MMKAVLLWLALSGTIQADPLASCASCHPAANASMKDSDSQCRSCHEAIVEGSTLPVSLHAAQNLMAKRTYLSTGPLQWQVTTRNGHKVTKYRPEGLLRFLAAPIPRRSWTGYSMHPLNEIQLAAVRSQIKGIAEQAPSEVTHGGNPIKGKRLYSELGCGNCHGQKGNIAPALRIGYPLLSLAFFKAKVSGTIAEGSMPSFPRLKAADLTSLYRYISADSGDLPKYRRDTLSPIPSTGNMLYQTVQREVFGGSCRHCHSSQAKSQSAIAAVFGGDRHAGFEVSRDERGKTVASLKGSIAGHDKCAMSHVITRLKERAKEWTGEDDLHLVGMPLGLTPLPDRDIRTLEMWTALGCPTPGGKSCDACRK